MNSAHTELYRLFHNDTLFSWLKYLLQRNLLAWVICNHVRMLDPSAPRLACWGPSALQLVFHQN